DQITHPGRTLGLLNQGLGSRPRIRLGFPHPPTLDVVWIVERNRPTLPPQPVDRQPVGHHPEPARQRAAVPPLVLAKLARVLIEQGQEDVLADVLDFLSAGWTAELLKNYRNAVRDDSGIF